MNSYPYWRLSGFYFFFFASVGALTPYWGLYLQSLGFGPQRIGELTAILLATKVVAPNMWAWVADHSERTLPVVRLAALMAFVVFLGLFRVSSFWAIALVLFGFSFFWNAVLPQVEAVTLNHLGPAATSYGRIRLWGSFGFIVFVLLLGPVVEYYGAAAILPAVAGALLGVWLLLVFIPEPVSMKKSNVQGRFMELLRRPEVLVLLLCCLLMQASHAPFYAFFSIYLSDYGYAKSSIGALWAFGTVCEIGVFYFMHRVQKRFDVVSILILSFMVTALRWTLVAMFPQWPWVIIFTQALHAITFGAYHTCALQLIRGMFQGQNQHRGLALYGSISFGVGGALGSLYSGFLWGEVSPQVTFVVAALVALAAAGLLIRIIGPVRETMVSTG